MERNGMEWNGMERNGMKWNGTEWDGMEWNGTKWYGIYIYIYNICIHILYRFDTCV